MNAFMVDTKEIYNVEKGSEGVQKVLDGGYAYIMESTSLKYELTKNCSLIQIGGELNSIMYSIALPKHSPYTNHISDTILKLKENQIILNLYNKWWQVNNNPCTDQNKGPSGIESNQLGLPNFVGVFLVLGLLLAVAFILLIIEMICGARKASRESQMSVCEEFLHNLKFAARGCCKKHDQKPAKWQREVRGHEEVCEENFYGSLDRLSLSIGSLNTSTMPAWSDHPTIRSRSPPRSRPTSISDRRRFGSLRRHSASDSSDSLEMRENLLDTNKKATVHSSSTDSLLTVRDRMTQSFTLAADTICSIMPYNVVSIEKAPV
ncbi:glutamate receptor ionotropic, kainate 2-like [Watersipora subatra]|uniref:glutamate receptor ionotropic, kainate 2-like n=1 Tax=Watersipora subatra TaxID=2589382 RepID=UPI00355B57C6